MSSTSIEDLLAKDAINSCLNNYALGMDLRNADRFRQAWHEDGVWEINSAVGDRPLRGRGHAGITETVHALWAMQQLVLHATTNHEIHITSDGRATGQAHAVVLGVTSSGAVFADAVVYPEDRLELRDGTWRLTYRRVEVGMHAELPDSALLQLFIGAGGAFGPANK